MSHSAFSYVVAEKADLYRAIMAAFMEAKAHFTVHLRPEDVRERAGVASLEEVQAALSQLQQWGNLEADPDTSRVTSVEEFYRARYLYQLTRSGEAAEQALQVFDRELGRRGALQTVALDDIRLRLRSLHELAGQERPDPTQVQLLLRDLSHVFADLAENARAFMSSLSRTLELRGNDQGALIAYKERLIGYIERFIGDLVTTSAEIAGTLRALDTGGPGQRPIDPLLRMAAERELEDLAPDPDGPEDLDTLRATRYQEVRAHWEGHWEGLKTWFLDQPQRRAQASLLRAQARRAISQMLEAVQ
ncbi:MAG: TIGR02677 family protein, partial [Chromatiaceae bacterium]